VDGQHWFVADEAPVFAERVITLLKDRALGQLMGQAARAFMLDHYGIEAVANQVEKMYIEAIEKFHAPS
jgi:glycosyltransferase involved in cell wall biosynthesis